MRTSLLSLFLFFFSRSALSAYGFDYIWSIATPTGWSPAIESPEAGCHSLDGTSSMYGTFTYRGYKFFQENAVQCIHTHITAEGQNRGEVGTISIYRFGDGCSGGKIYNPTKHICTIPDTSAGIQCLDQGEASLGNPLIKQVDGNCKPLSQSPTQKGYEAGPSCGATAGNPINFSSGNKVQTETDLSPQSGSTLSLERTYNSIDGLWRHNFSTHLNASQNFLIITLSDGKEVYFQVTNGLIQPTRKGTGELRKISNGWEYSTPDNKRLGYDNAGKLIFILSASGKKITLTHNPNYITLTDSYGSSLRLTEDGQHQPLRLKGSLVDIQYTYDNLGRLISTSRSLNSKISTRRYSYDSTPASRLLTSIIDERGIQFAKWTYDNQGRAISSEHAGGAEKVTVAYNADGSSTVTNALGKRTTYRFQTIQGIRRITAIEGEPSANCPNSNATFTYDDRGLVKTSTDNKGNITTFDYNERGLEVSRTEAYGTPQARTVITEWHPTLFLPVTITEPDRTTRYSYDVQGRLTGQATTQR